MGGAVGAAMSLYGGKRKACWGRWGGCAVFLKTPGAGILTLDPEGGCPEEKARLGGRRSGRPAQRLRGSGEARLHRSGHGGEVGVDGRI